MLRPTLTIKDVQKRYLAGMSIFEKLSRGFKAEENMVPDSQPHEGENEITRPKKKPNLAEIRERLLCK